MEKHTLIPKEKCPHVLEVKIVESDGTACSVCNDTEHLRQCTSCGQVFCCESSQAHNKKHFEETGHPIIKSHGAPYSFYWCYKCNGYIDI